MTRLLRLECDLADIESSPYNHVWFHTTIARLDKGMGVSLDKIREYTGRDEKELRTIAILSLKSGFTQTNIPFFPRNQVVEETIAIRQDRLDRTKSKVYGVWEELAYEWLSSGENDYAADGFKGFYDRSPSEILFDFHENDLLEVPLTDDEVEKLLNLESEA